MGVLFETDKRRRRDLVMGRRRYVPLRRLGNVPLRRRWGFLMAGGYLSYDAKVNKIVGLPKPIQRLTILQRLELQN